MVVTIIIKWLSSYNFLKGINDICTCLVENRLLNCCNLIHFIKPRSPKLISCFARIMTKMCSTRNDLKCLLYLGFFTTENARLENFYGQIYHVCFSVLICIWQSRVYLPWQDQIDFIIFLSLTINQQSFFTQKKEIVQSFSLAALSRFLQAIRKASLWPKCICNSSTLI